MLFLSVILGSSVLDLNLVLNYIWNIFPLSKEILLFGLGLKGKVPLFLVGLGLYFLRTYRYHFEYKEKKCF